MMLNLKPSNIFLLEGGDSNEIIVKVTDVGLSQMTRSSNPKYVDSLQFLAEEVITWGEVSAKSDIWSLGAIIYFLVSQKLTKLYDPGTGVDRIEYYN